MLAGNLDRRIQILRNDPTADALGGQADDWREIATVWASKLEISDAERLRASEEGSTVTMRFQIRWSPTVADLDPRDRLVFDGRTFDISAVKEIGRRDGLELTAGARAERVCDR